MTDVLIRGDLERERERDKQTHAHTERRPGKHLHVKMLI